MLPIKSSKITLSICPSGKSWQVIPQKDITLLPCNPKSKSCETLSEFTKFYHHFQGVLCVYVCQWLKTTFCVLSATTVCYQQQDLSAAELVTTPFTFFLIELQSALSLALFSPFIVIPFSLKFFLFPGPAALNKAVTISWRLDFGFFFFFKQFSQLWTMLE